MRHRKKFNHLSRTSAHRKALLSNLAISLIIHKRIETTVAKAKELRTYVEPLINKTKNLTTVDQKRHAQRLVFSKLHNNAATKELFENVAEKVANRPGGYTRIIKTRYRIGDAAHMCFIELVDFNANMIDGYKKQSEAKQKRTRRGRGKKQSDEGQQTPEAKATPEKEAAASN